MVADDPDNKIEMKIFHNAILNDHAALSCSCYNTIEYNLFSEDGY